MNSEIVKNRMANVIVTLFKPDHTPLASQEVSIAQTRHKFLFGTAVWCR